MQGYNCILVYSEDRSEILFCKRLNDPYEGMYNLVGGKIELGEDGFHAAYRELFEETGISREDVTLYHMMDFTYYNQNCFVEVYTGVLQADVELRPEKHPLHWISAEENFLIWKSTREKEISGIWWYRRNALDRGSRSNLENMFYKSHKKW